MTNTELGQVKNTNILGVEVETYEECGFCTSKKSALKLYIPWTIWSEWKYISNEMGDKEWGAVFWVENNIIIKYAIPKQEVSNTECEFKEELGGDGMVHSHHSMGAFHSGQDDKHERNLYGYSIVISDDDNICTKRVKLPCKGFGYKDVDIMISGIPETVKIDNISVKNVVVYNTTTKQSVFEKYNVKTEARPLAGNQFTDEFPCKCDTCKEFDCQNCDEYINVQRPLGQSEVAIYD